jgi:hypothetical protein
VTDLHVRALRLDALAVAVLLPQLLGASLLEGVVVALVPGWGEGADAGEEEGRVRVEMRALCLWMVPS